MGRMVHLEVGRLGERIATAYIKQKGYRIIGTNVRTPLGELDIISRKCGLTVFIEVKTRLSASFGPPYLSVTGRKLRKIEQNAVCYLKKHGLLDSQWQIDVISVILNDAHTADSIDHIENITG